MARAESVCVTMSRPTVCQVHRSSSRNTGADGTHLQNILGVVPAGDASATRSRPERDGISAGMRAKGDRIRSPDRDCVTARRRQDIIAYVIVGRHRSAIGEDDGAIRCRRTSAVCDGAEVIVLLRGHGDIFVVVPSKIRPTGLLGLFLRS